MSAFMTKLGQWFIKYVVSYVVRYVVRYVWDHVTAWYERRRASEAQRKKDEESKKPYDQAVQNGTHEQIENETEGRLNG